MAEEKDTTPEFKELEDGSLQVGGEARDNDEDNSNDDNDGDERLNSNDSGDETEPAGETEEEAEARRERNRARRAQNKQHRKDYIESLKRELSARDKLLDELSSRVASVEQHSVGNQAAQLDAAIAEAAKYYNHFKAVNRQAIEHADGQTAVDAQEKMFAAQQRHEMLVNAKKNLAPRNQQPRPLDPRMAQNAQEWIERNAWYDPSGADQDSELVMQLDARLVREGWNPTTREYWEELDSRVKKYLPHKAVSGYNNNKSGTRSRSPVSGTGEANSVPNKGGYRLSAERVQALKDAGVYDDPKKRAEYIKTYQEYDRQNGQTK